MTGSVKTSQAQIFETDYELNPIWIDTTSFVAYWKFDESAAFEGTTILDAAAAAAPGILKTNSDGTLKSDFTPRFGKSLLLDGTDDFVLVPNPLDKHLDFDRGSFTYMAWVKVASSSGSWDMPIWKGGNSAAEPGYDMELGTNVWAGYVSDGVSIFNVDFGQESEFLGRWVHLAVVVDRNTRQLRGYADGVLKSATDISNLGSVNSNHDLKIGSSGLEGSYFKGSLDDVAIWQSALSANEILEIYNRLRAKF